jgi:Family of unknown function (DUF6884)
VSAPRLAPVSGPRSAEPAELVVVGCSAEKAATDLPIPALDLYDGGCVPPLRARVGHLAHLRAKVRFLSAQHGLVSANTRLLPYDRPLDPQRASQLRPEVWANLQADFRAGGVPDQILVIAEPLYMVLLADLLAGDTRPGIVWIPDHADGWADAAAVLDEWGW